MIKSTRCLSHFGTALLAFASMAAATPVWAKASYIEFDVPGAVSTSPVSIDGQNDVAGDFRKRTATIMASSVSPDGTFSTFDPIGAHGTFVAAINAGIVVGSYRTRNNVERGFLRTPDGAITTFNFPQALSTEANAINGSGVVVGYYSSLNSNVYHGFVRQPTGKMTTIDVPGATFTYPVGINEHGEIAGSWGSSDGGHSRVLANGRRELMCRSMYRGRPLSILYQSTIPDRLLGSIR